jgi:hypothetical protein
MLIKYIQQLSIKNTFYSITDVKKLSTIDYIKYIYLYICLYRKSLKNAFFISQYKSILTELTIDNFFKIRLKCDKNKIKGDMFVSFIRFYNS